MRFRLMISVHICKRFWTRRPACRQVVRVYDVMYLSSLICEKRYLSLHVHRRAVPLSLHGGRGRSTDVHVTFPLVCTHCDAMRFGLRPLPQDDERCVRAREVTQVTKLVIPPGYRVSPDAPSRRAARPAKGGNLTVASRARRIALSDERSSGVTGSGVIPCVACPLSPATSVAYICASAAACASVGRPPCLWMRLCKLSRGSVR